MLWKLLRYDFRAMWKQFSIIWPATLVIALINRFVLPIRDRGIGGVVDGDNLGMLANVMIIIFVMLMFFMFILSMIFILQRFYKGLLGDEGYLMHTLPVHSWQLVLSKLICAIFVTIMNMIVAFLAMFLILPWTWAELAQLFTSELWSMIMQGLREKPDTLLYMLEFLLIFISGLALSLTTVYLAMAIGHLFSRRRVLMSVVAFIGIDIVINVVTDFVDHADWLDKIVNGGNHLNCWIIIAFMLIPAGIFFAGTSYILKNRLNLE